MAKATTGARILLGLIFVVFGLNGFLQFLPMPPLPEGAMAFLGGLMSAPYFFPVLKVLEIGCGAALLAGMYVPLALVLLAPIVVQIFLFHLFLDMSGIALPVFIVILEAWLGYAYKSSFKGVLSKNAKPH